MKLFVLMEGFRDPAVQSCRQAFLSPHSSSVNPNKTVTLCVDSVVKYRVLQKRRQARNLVSQRIVWNRAEPYQDAAHFSP